MEEYPGADQIKRMVKAAKVHKFKELAELIGQKQSTLSTWKKRGVPEGELYKISHLLNCSPEWLRTGKGEMRPDTKKIETLDPKLARAVIAERIDRSGSTEPMTLTTTEAEIIELLRDLPEDARLDEYDTIRDLWLRLCRGKNPPV